MSIVFRSAHNIPLVNHYGIATNNGLVIDFDGVKVNVNKNDGSWYSSEKNIEFCSFFNNCEHFVQSIVDTNYCSQFFRIFVIFLFMFIGFLHLFDRKYFATISFAFLSFLLNLFLSFL